MTGPVHVAPGTEAGVWHKLVEQSPTALVIVNAEGRILYANRRAQVLAGTASVDDLIGAPALRFVPPADRALIMELFHSVLAGRIVAGRRWQVLRSSGGLLDVELDATWILLDGAPAVRFGFRDIAAPGISSSSPQQGEGRWQTVFENSPVGISLSDEDGNFAAVNPSLCTLLGRSPDDLLGRSAAEFTHPEDRTVTAAAGTLINASTDGVAHIEKRYLRPTGEIRYAWLTITHTPGPDGETWTLAHVQDVTERRAAERDVLESRTTLREVSEVVRQIQSGSDARQTIVRACQRLAEADFISLLEPVPGQNALEVSASTSDALVGTAVPLDGSSVSARVYRSGDVAFLADARRHPQISSHLLSLTGATSVYIVPVRSAEAITGLLIAAWERPLGDLDDHRAQAVTLLVHHAGVALRQAALVSELEAASLSDPLTGLPNRRRWDRALDDILAAAGRHRRPLTVALVDIDGFKAFNDTHGHLAGDELLRELADVFRSVLRDVDDVARWGGDEFAVGLPDCSAEEATPILERLRRTMPRHQTCSIGFATWDGNVDGGALMARVDAALYAAKRGGRDRSVGASAEPVRAEPARTPGR